MPGSYIVYTQCTIPPGQCARHCSLVLPLYVQTVCTVYMHYAVIHQQLHGVFTTFAVFTVQCTMLKVSIDNVYTVYFLYNIIQVLTVQTDPIWFTIFYSQLYLYITSLMYIHNVQYSNRLNRLMKDTINIEAFKNGQCMYIKK